MSQIPVRKRRSFDETFICGKGCMNPPTLGRASASAKPATLAQAQAQLSIAVTRIVLQRETKRAEFAHERHELHQVLNHGLRVGAAYTEGHGWNVIREEARSL